MIARDSDKRSDGSDTLDRVAKKNAKRNKETDFLISLRRARLAAVEHLLVHHLDNAILSGLLAEGDVLIYGGTDDSSLSNGSHSYEEEGSCKHSRKPCHCIYDIYVFDKLVV
ncbi:hypothetical protein Tco_1203002 [Tanacetum coccineum]